MDDFSDDFSEHLFCGNCDCGLFLEIGDVFLEIGDGESSDLFLTCVGIGGGESSGVFFLTCAGEKHCIAFLFFFDGKPLIFGGSHGDLDLVPL